MSAATNCGERSWKDPTPDEADDWFRIPHSQSNTALKVALVKHYEAFIVVCYQTVVLWLKDSLASVA
jgi:hypothetical protein